MAVTHVRTVPFMKGLVEYLRDSEAHNENALRYVEIAGVRANPYSYEKDVKKTRKLFKRQDVLHGYHYMVSFSKEELDPFKEEDHTKAMNAGLSLIKRIDPDDNHQWFVVVQNDGFSNCLHLHILGSNLGLHGKCLRGNQKSQQALRHVMDEVCAELGIRNINAERDASKSRNVSVAERALESDPRAKVWKRDICDNVEQALSDRRVHDKASFDEALSRFGITVKYARSRKLGGREQITYTDAGAHVARGTRLGGPAHPDNVYAAWERNLEMLEEEERKRAEAERLAANPDYAEKIAAIDAARASQKAYFKIGQDVRRRTDLTYYDPASTEPVRVGIAEGRRQIAYAVAADMLENPDRTDEDYTRMLEDSVCAIDMYAYAKGCAGSLVGKARGLADAETERMAMERTAAKLRVVGRDIVANMTGLETKFADVCFAIQTTMRERPDWTDADFEGALAGEKYVGDLSAYTKDKCAELVASARGTMANYESELAARRAEKAASERARQQELYGRIYTTRAEFEEEKSYGGDHAAHGDPDTAGRMSQLEYLASQMDLGEEEEEDESGFYFGF